MRTVAVIAALLLLSACASSEERAAQAAAQRAEMDARDDSQCQSYGAAPGTDQYFKCRMMISQQRFEAMRTMMAQMPAMMAQLPRPASPQPYMMPMPQLPSNPNVNCTTSYIGNQAYTHCN